METCHEIEGIDPRGILEHHVAHRRDLNGIVDFLSHVGGVFTVEVLEGKGATTPDAPRGIEEQLRDSRIEEGAVEAIKGIAVIRCLGEKAVEVERCRSCPNMTEGISKSLLPGMQAAIFGTENEGAHEVRECFFGGLAKTGKGIACCDGNTILPVVKSLGNFRNSSG